LLWTGQVLVRGVCPEWTPPAATGEELAFGAGRCQSGGSFVGGRRLAVAAEPAEEVGAGGVVVAKIQRVHKGQCGGPVDLADRDGAVEGHDRGGVEGEQLPPETEG